jgi:voltage-dependent potassium channel beta subunit
MEYRRLGQSGLKVSALSFGSWVTFAKQLDVDMALQVMSAAYDAGVNFFDNAEIYAHGESERVMGKALKKAGWSRDSYIVSSKVRWGAVPGAKPTQMGLSRKHIVEACHQAIKRLKLDYIDLYYCHRPDPEVPMEEIVRSMTELIYQGKIFYWGTSMWSAQQIMEAHSVARQFNLIPPIVEQPEYNMFERDLVEREYGRLYDAIGMGTTIFSPLKMGILSGKYNDAIPDNARMNQPGNEWFKQMFESEAWQRRLGTVRKLTAVADELGTNMARLALAWCLKNPHVSSVITGASRVEQVHDNMKALQVLPQLTDDVMEKIEALLDNKPAPMGFQ